MIAPFLAEFQSALSPNGFLHQLRRYRREVDQPSCLNIQESDIVGIILNEAFSALYMLTH